MPVEKLYTDEDVNPLLAEILSQRGYPATTARACGHLGLSDKDHFLFAANHGHTLFTHNIRDFCVLAKQFSSDNISHSGIILAPQWKLSELLLALLRLLTNLKNQDPTNRVFWLHRYRGK